MADLELLERQFPWIKWREPIRVNGRFACRICIARTGLKGTDVDALPKSLLVVESHIAREHMGPRRRSNGR